MKRATGTVAVGVLLGYAAYGVAATLLFVYWQFPFDRLEQWLVAKVAHATLLRLEPRDRHVRFPLLLEWDRIGVAGVRGAPDGVLQGERLSVDLALLPLLDRTVSAAIRMRLLAGEVAGVAEWQGAGATGRYHLQGRARGLDLAYLANESIPAGSLRGDWDYRWGEEGALKGQGMLTAEFNGVKLGPGLSGVAALPPLTFREVVARIAFDKGVGTVEGFRAEGADALVQGGGSVILQSPLEDSLLNLNLQVRLRAGASWGDGQYRFVIRGTLRRPVFTLDDGATPPSAVRQRIGKA